MPSISYAITACNEHVELDRLLQQLNEYIRPEDEIIVQLDNTATNEVKKVAESYNVGTFYEYHRIIFGLNNDFASFKNNLKEHCSRDYIFQIDADEYLTPELLHYLPEILEMNPEIELYAVPRINTVEDLTPGHILKWGWRINEKGWVNYPDYQQRIFKNLDRIKWVNKVHERIVGARTTEPFPDGFNLNLIHPKTIERQEKQNNFYNTL
jgi:glycosyltransferase involved in cell wall biosynthesis